MLTQVKVRAVGNARNLGPSEGKVILNVQGAPAGVEQPAHIHKGACPTPGDVVYPLNSVVNGVSETVLDATVDALVGGLPLAVNVHKSQSEVNMYVACGDVVAF